MDILTEYLMNDYVSEKERLKSVNEIIKKVIPTYGKFNNKLGWEYEFVKCKANSEVSSKAKNEVESEQKKVSTSTLSMIAYSMKVLKYGISDLNGTEMCSDIASHYKALGDEGCKVFDNIFEESKKLLIEKYKNNGRKFLSDTYGTNDPFTRVWIQNLFKNDNKNEFLKELKQDEYVKGIFQTIYSKKNDLNYNYSEKNNEKKSIESNHVFPLLKVIQLYDLIRPKIEEEYVKGAKSEMMNTLFKHLSLADIENANFDTAELVFSLEGILLLDDNKENFDKSLVKRVFDVIKERQTISMYWRPLKPFVMNERGLALLPLSVEIAMSLIRICRLLGKFGEKLFSDYISVFNSYTEWLKTRMNIVSCDKGIENECDNSHCFESSKNSGKFYGWCSEHVHQSDVIHLWETSQVLIYLANFNSMLQKHIALRTFKYANFSYKDCGYKEGSWDEWMEGEPLDQDSFRVYSIIKDRFIKEGSSFKSMLLYGPPGTGKSTVADELAKAKGWPLVTITPSDFIANGADLVEAKAKNIFKVLEEQEKMVVLFDEIDRLVLDRDSDEYTKQSDIFQFMTPSMLVKIKDLRTKGKIIFIIATNYEERIDMAIKRTGRIDEKYLVLPPSRNQRERLLIKEAKKNFNKKIDKFKELKIKKENVPLKYTDFIKLVKKEVEGLDELNEEMYEFIKKIEIFDNSKIIDKTALFTYTEFTQLVKNLFDEDIADLDDFIESPSISIVSCSKKITDSNWCQKPYKEFFALAYLKAECGGYTQEEEKSIVDVISQMLFGKKGEDEIQKFDKSDKENAKKKITEYVNGDMAKEIVSNLLCNE
jgi:cytidylate kinase